MLFALCNFALYNLVRTICFVLFALWNLDELFVQFELCKLVCAILFVNFVFRNLFCEFCFVYSVTKKSPFLPYRMIVSFKSYSNNNMDWRELKNFLVIILLIFLFLIISVKTQSINFLTQHTWQECVVEQHPCLAGQPYWLNQGIFSEILFLHSSLYILLCWYFFQLKMTLINSIPSDPTMGFSSVESSPSKCPSDYLEKWDRAAMVCFRIFLLKY